MVNTIVEYASILKDVFLCLPLSIQAMFYFAFVLVVLAGVISLIRG